MFGYITPEKTEMKLKDFYLYKAYYCGLCIASGKAYGQFSRFTTNYDFTFLNSLVHSYKNTEPAIVNRTCILHPFKKRSTIADDITNKLTAVNVLLIYRNALDDVYDEKSFKARNVTALLKRAYKKAKKDNPEAEEIINTQYTRLTKLEKNGESVLDKLSDPFSVMMALLGINIIEEENEYFYNLCYNLGKWVYLIDALDDFDKDTDKNNFNPFRAAYPGCNTKNELLEKYKEDVSAVFYCALNAIAENYRILNIKSNICENILFLGIRNKTKAVLEGKKCEKIRI